MSDLEKRFVPFGRRIRIVRAWRGLAIGGSIGAAMAALFAILDWAGVAYTGWSILLAVFGGGMALGAVIGILMRVPVEAIADSIDRRGHLKDRLFTAVEAGDRGAFGAEQVRDASTHLAALRPAQLYPLRVGRWQAGAAGLFVAASAIFLLGNSALLLSDQEKRDREELQKAAAAIERIVKPLEKDPAFGEKAEERELMQKLEQFREELKRGRLPKQEALQDANQLAEKAKELYQKRFEGAEQALQNAEQALRKLAQQEMDKRGLKMDPSQMAASPTDAQAMDEKIGKLDEQIKDIEKQLADGKSSLSPSEKRSLQRKLQELKLSREAQETFRKLMQQPEMKEIMKMMQKLREGTKASAQGEQQPLSEEELERMQKELEELAKKLQDPEAMKQFLEDLKKSLKECEGG